MRATVGLRLVGLMVAVALPCAALAEIVAASGLSTDPDPAAAGRTAAEQAKKALGDKAPKLVLVFECFPKPDKARVLEGIASVFPKAIIHGCSGAAPITSQGNPRGKSCGLLALGGDVEVAAAVSPRIAGKHADAGETLAKALPKLEKPKLLILFGDCHIPANKPLVEGVQKVLGNELMIIGGAASGPSTDCFFQGELKEGVAVGILLAGDFNVSAVSGQGHETSEQMIATAVATAKAALEGLKGKPAVGFLFECNGRLGKVKDAADELKALQEVLGKNLPLIGFYGSGEMGPERDVVTAFGWHVVACVIGK